MYKYYCTNKKNLTIPLLSTQTIEEAQFLILRIKPKMVNQRFFFMFYLRYMKVKKIQEN